MIFKLACGDVLPGCAARFESPRQDDLMEQVAGHAAAAHGITEITDDIRALVERKIAVVP